MSLTLPFLKDISQVHFCWVTQGLCPILTASVSVSNPWGPHLSWSKPSCEINKHIPDQEGITIQLIRPQQCGSQTSVKILLASPGLSSSVTGERGTRELDSLMEWTGHHLFMFCSALFIMKFIIWEHSFDHLCLIDFRKNNKSTPCLLYKGSERQYKIFRMFWKVLHRTYNCNYSYYHHYDSQYWYER